MQVIESRGLIEVSTLTRDDVVPYYRYLIIHDCSDAEVKRVNDLILTKWSSSGLTYIKEKAWKGNEKYFYV